MGDLSYWDHYEQYGGEPLPGEAHPSPEGVDHLRKSARENGLHHHRNLRAPESPREAPAGEGTPSRPAPAGIPSRRRAGASCDCCSAPEDARCQPWCRGEQVS